MHVASHVVDHIDKKSSLRNVVSWQAAYETPRACEFVMYTRLVGGNKFPRKVGMHYVFLFLDVKMTCAHKGWHKNIKTTSGKPPWLTPEKPKPLIYH